MATSQRLAEQQTLPHNLEAERSVLGAIMVHNPGLDLIDLAPEDFYRSAHRQIYDAIIRLAAQRQAIDTLTVKIELERVAQLDECGGPVYIAALSDGVPRSTNVQFYAAIVREKAQLRSVIFTCNRLMSSAYVAEERAGDLLLEADRSLLNLQTHGTKSNLVSMRAGVTELFKDLEYRLEHRGEVSGVVTGFDNINRLTGGWGGGDMVILGARPSIGKTSFVVNTAIASAQSGAKIGFFSFEMKRRQLEYRILSHLSGINSMRLLSGHVGSKDQEVLGPALAQLSELPIWIDDSSSLNVWDIRAACRRMKAEHGLDLVIIDYVQLIADPPLDRRGASRNDYMTETSRRLKLTAGELNVPILVLSQLNRANDKRPDPKPRLSDLRDSGSLEQDADLVCFLHRKDHREGGFTEFMLAKARNGPTGTANLDFHPETTTFHEWQGEPPVEAPKAAKKTKARAPEPETLPLPEE
jgi:replicative DNA helicase